MEKKVRIGVIGCGGIANGKHMPAEKRNPASEMVAFCDIIEERAVKARDEYGTPDSAVYTDYRELLKDKSIDAVLVLTPNCAHCEITVAALNAGKHVLCEKPMAMNYAEAKKMLDARDKSGKVLTIGYQNRFRPDALYMKARADEDMFGDIYYAEAIAIRRRAVPTWGVFIDQEKQGGGPLIDIGTHALDLTLFMMNNYEPAYCVVKDSAFGFVVMKNGAVIYLNSSWALNMADPREAITTICGDKGGADMLDGLRMNTVLGGKQVMIKPDLGGASVAFFDGAAGGAPEDLESACFTNAILGKGKLYVTADQAAVVTHILEGIYESDKTGKPYYFD